MAEVIQRTCANPDCFNYPIRGERLCIGCSTKRDCLVLAGILLGACAIFAAIVRFL